MGFVAESAVVAETGERDAGGSRSGNDGRCGRNPVGNIRVLATRRAAAAAVRR